MSLKQYKQKRDFNKTTEPRPKISKSSSKKQIFVIHKHQASHLHYDLRLEMNSVLKSWAVPKKPPTKKGIKRLAIQVEDHPLSYKDFEGIIPEGNYGAGKVEIWDNGAYELKEKNLKKIEFKLNGKKLKGNFVLVKTRYGRDERSKKKSWLWFKV